MHARDEWKKDSEYESDMEQQQGCKYVLHLEPNSSVCLDFPIDRDACHVYDQFPKYFEHEVTNDCIDNHMFLVEHYQYDLNFVLQLSRDHNFKEEVVSPDDQDLLMKKEESYQFSSKEAFMDEHFFLRINRYLSLVSKIHLQPCWSQFFQIF
jgi:hypothetical protein